MLNAFAYLLVRGIVGLWAPRRSRASADLEVIVLRHGLVILRRQVKRLELRSRDRLFSLGDGAGSRASGGEAS